MSSYSQVTFQAVIYSRVIFQAIAYLAVEYTNAAANHTTTALLQAQQAMSLLEIILADASSNQIKSQELLTVEVAYVDLELFSERLQKALDILKPQSAVECLES